MEGEYQTISFEAAKALLDREPSCMLLDVREEEEYITGHAEGAVLFPLDTICAGTAAAVIPEKSTPVLVYCRSGKRSQQAARTLLDLGYTRVYDLGSLAGWPYGISWD